MANRMVLLNEGVLIDMAKAIQAKKGDTIKRKPREMVDAVKSLNASLGVFDSDITVNVVQSANQTITATVKDYALNKVDNANGFRLTTNLQFDATVTANEGYTAGTVSISRSGNTVTISASDAIKEGGTVNNWVTYLIDDSYNTIKIVNGVEEPWNGYLIDAERAVLTGDVNNVLSSLKGMFATSTILKLDVNSTNYIDLTLYNRVGEILVLGDILLSSVSVYDSHLILDARRLNGNGIINPLRGKVYLGKEHYFIILINPDAYRQIKSIPSTINLTIAVDDTNGDVSDVITDLKSRGATAMTLSEFKAQRADIADYIE